MPYRDLSGIVKRLDKPHTRSKAKIQHEWLKHVNVADFLERIEVANVSHATSDEMLFSCPFPGHSHGDERPSAYMNDGSKDKRLTTVWKCHGCGRSGNGITFLAEHEDISKQAAIRELKAIYAPGFTKPKDGIHAEFAKRRRQLEEQRAIEAAPLKRPVLEWKMYHERFGFDWGSIGQGQVPAWARYILDRGFTPAELEEWAIGYDRDSKRVAIPVCDEEGNLIGIKGRAWQNGVKPKYRILGDTERTKRWRGKGYGFQPYEKSLVVFGIDKLGAVERYVFVEGEIDVISLWKMGIPAICTGSASMSDIQAKIIRDHCDEIVIFLDNDAAGSHGIWGFYDKSGDFHPGAVQKLSPFIRVRIVGKHRRDANDYLVRGEEDGARRLIEKAKMYYLLQPDHSVV